MNIAILVYGDRVMPRFGCPRKIIVVTVEDDSGVSTTRLSSKGDNKGGNHDASI